VIAGGSLRVGGNYKLALALAVPARVGDNIATPAALGNIEYLHKVLFTLLTAGRIDGLSAWAAPACPDSPVRQPKG
jgi:hypothetical protein